jgi:hypothetical protein
MSAAHGSAKKKRKAKKRQLCIANQVYNKVLPPAPVSKLLSKYSTKTTNSHFSFTRAEIAWKQQQTKLMKKLDLEPRKKKI